MNGTKATGRLLLHVTSLLIPFQLPNLTLLLLYHLQVLLTFLTMFTNVNMVYVDFGCRLFKTWSRFVQVTQNSDRKESLPIRQSGQSLLMIVFLVIASRPAEPTAHCVLR